MKKDFQLSRFRSPAATLCFVGCRQRFRQQLRPAALIARRALSDEEVNAARIAIPGKYTTANFLLSLAWPAATDKVEMVFSEIEEAVLDGSVDAGLIIHENRFTYEQKGLCKIADLGEFWES